MCIRDSKQVNIGTAAKGSTLKILGETKNNIYITFGAMSTKFKIRPVVVDNISMPINIAGPFLKRHNIDQIHSKDSLRIQGTLLPLLSEPSFPHNFEAIDASIIFPSDMTIPPYSANHVNLVIPEIQRGCFPVQSGSVVGSIDFMDKTQCHPWINAIAKPADDGSIPVSYTHLTLPTTPYV